MFKSLSVHRSRGFTLIELLVVIAIIAILVALLLPAVQAVREAARRSQCQDQLHNLAIAMHNYEGTHKTFPINWGEGFTTTNRQETWIMGILTFIEQKPLSDTINFSAPYSSNIAIADTPINLLLCPTDPTYGIGLLASRHNIDRIAAVTSYKAVAGGNWQWGGFVFSSTKGLNMNNADGLDAGNGVICRQTGRTSRTPATRHGSIADGTSNTLALGEAVAGESSHNSWFFWNHTTASTGVPLNHYLPLGKYAITDWGHNYNFASMHPGGGHFAALDGKTTFLSENIDFALYRALGSISGGESVSIP